VKVKYAAVITVKYFIRFTNYLTE